MRSIIFRSWWKSSVLIITLFLSPVFLAGCSSGKHGGNSAASGATSVSQPVTTTGGTLRLPGVATLTVPPGSVTAATIELAQVDIPQMDSVINDTLPDHTLLNTPRIRIKSSVPFNDIVLLQLMVPQLTFLIPNNQRPIVVALIRQEGGDGEVMDTVFPIGGNVCGNSNAMCVSLGPSLFMQSDPFNPLDPVAYVAIASVPIQNACSPENGGGIATGCPEGPDHIYTVENVNPSGIDIVPTGEEIPISATVTLDQTSLSPTIAGFSSPLLIPLQIVAGGDFGNVRPDHIHAGVDLETLHSDGLKVLAVAPGSAEPRGPNNTGGGGYTVNVTHSTNLLTKYMHLEPDDPQTFVRPSGDVALGQQIGLSDSSGHVEGPHLHFEVWLDDMPIDPWPLLPQRDLTGYYPYKLKLLIWGADFGEVVDAKEINAPGDPSYQATILAGRLEEHLSASNYPVAIFLWICGGHLALGEGCRTLAEWKVFAVQITVESGSCTLQALSDTLTRFTTTGQGTASGPVGVSLSMDPPEDLYGPVGPVPASTCPEWSGPPNCQRQNSSQPRTTNWTWTTSIDTSYFQRNPTHLNPPPPPPPVGGVDILASITSDHFGGPIITQGTGTTTDCVWVN